MSSDEFAFIELPLIEPSLTNPRKHFNEAKLQELADSIRASGVHQPILVRKLPGFRVADTSFDPQSCKPRAVRPVYELVSGERRYRASQLAGAPTIPALIRDLSDDQVLEVQIVENLQRDDLSELEEAEGYDALMQISELSADQVGAKIGKSRSYVYGRLKLLDLSLESKQALREGKIDASRALLIARIPDGKLQLKALEFATTPSGYPPEPPSVRRLQGWLKDNVMLRLEQAIFKLTDARLVEAAGSCTTCPKRTGANPDLFADVDSADICTDPPCYHGKQEAHRAQLVKKAEAKGLRIVQDKEAIELMQGNQYRTTPTGYVALATQRPDLSQEGERPITLAQALGKDAPSPILFIHPRTQEVSELVPAEEAEAVLLAKGLIKAEKVRAEKLEDLQDSLEGIKSSVERETERAVRQSVHAAAVEAVRHSSAAQAKRLLCSEVLRAFLMSELDSAGEHAMAKMLCYEFQEGEDEVAAITGHIQRLGETDLLRAVALVFLDRDGFFHSEVSTPVLDAFVGELQVDAKAARRAAAADVKKKYAEQIRALQAEIDAQKAPAATGSAARPKEGPGGGDKGVRAAKKRPAAPAVLSAEEATQGIAAAMQGLEAQASASAVAPGAQPEGGDSAASEADLYDQAVAVVAREQKASKRLLKEALGIGQDRALALLEQMEANGVVSAVDETRNRKVLVAA
jgi:ParB/RepB/Spo0J family partition protein